MSILAQVESGITAAMKAKDQLRLQALRMAKTALKNKQIELIKELSSDEEIKVISTLVKQRKESIEQFTQAGRSDLADKEASEVKILSEFLPSALDAAELEKIISSTLEELGAKTAADMGRAIKAVMAKVAGRAEGKIVSDLIKSKLA